MSSSELLPRPMVLAEFLPLVDREFRVDCAPQAVSLQLVEARPLRDSGATLRPPFTLLFHSAPEILLVDGSNVMRSAGFGPDVIFLSPVTAPPGSPPGHYYEAVFN